MTLQISLLKSTALHAQIKNKQLNVNQAPNVLLEHYSDIKQQLRAHSVAQFYDFCEMIGVEQGLIFVLVNE